MRHSLGCETTNLQMADCDVATQRVLDCLKGRSVRFKTPDQRARRHVQCLCGSVQIRLLPTNPAEMTTNPQRLCMVL